MIHARAIHITVEGDTFTYRLQIVYRKWYIFPSRSDKLIDVPGRRRSSGESRWTETVNGESRWTETVNGESRRRRRTERRKMSEPLRDGVNLEKSRLQQQ